MALALYDPGVTYNYTDNPVDAFGTTWPAYSVALATYGGNEGPIGWPSIRFTAPADGTYNLSATWLNINTGGAVDTGTQVWLNTSVTGWGYLGNGIGGSYATTSSLNLMAGQTITLLTAVGSGTRTLADMMITGNTVTYDYNQWSGNTTGNWTASSPSNWTLSPIPNAVGALAEFGGMIAEPATVTVNAPVTVGILKFSNDFNSYTIAGSNAITLDNTGGTGNAGILFVGAHAISAPIVENGTVNISSSADFSSLTLNGVISDGTTPGGINYMGNGTGDTQTPTYRTLTLTGPNTFTGPVVMGSYGHLSVNSIGPTSAAGPLGKSGPDAANLVINGLLSYTGTASLPNTIVATDRGFTLAGDGMLDGIEVQNANVNLTFNGQIATTFTANAFQKTGPGTLTFDNTLVNTFAAGDFQVVDGAVVLKNGTFNKDRVDIGFQWGSGDFFVGFAVGMTPTMTIQNAVVNSTAKLYVGNETTGHVTVNDSQVTMSRELTLGSRNNGDSTNPGDGYLMLNGASTFTTGNAYVGPWGNSGHITVNDSGTLIIKGAIESWYGVNGGTATIDMSGTGELHLSPDAPAANQLFGFGTSSAATVTMTGHSKIIANTVNSGVYPAGWVVFGGNGGTANVTLGDHANLSVPTARLKIGDSYGGVGGIGTVTLNDSASITAGLVVAMGVDTDAEQAAGTGQGILNLNGGTVTAPGFFGHNSQINFAGGSLQANASSTDYISGGGISVSIGRNAVTHLGAVIDTDVNDITINTALLHDATGPDIDGGLLKLGSGLLTLSVVPTYNGDTFVNEGTLIASAGINTPDAAVSVATGATLNASSIVANTLAIGVTPLATVTVPEPGTLALLALAMLGGAVMAWRKEDRKGLIESDFELISQGRMVFPQGRPFSPFFLIVRRLRT